MNTDVLYSVNMYTLFCVKRFELIHVVDIALEKCHVIYYYYYDIFRRFSDAEQEYSLSKATVEHDKTWSPNGWVTITC